jgi:uncharacterized surface protein with fasciclin (FAS1) repeats
MDRRKTMNRFKVLLPVLAAVVLLAGSVAPAFAAGPPPFAGRPPKETIVEVASKINEETGEFSILIAALEVADPVVLNTLDGNGQFTVFAPTDQAFLDLLDELGLTAEQLLAEKELVTEVLLYHVAPGRRNSKAVLGSSRINTLQGGFLMQDGGVLTDNNGRTSKIIGTDVKAANGIIHVIDTVVLP